MATKDESRWFNVVDSAPDSVLAAASAQARPRRPSARRTAAFMQRLLAVAAYTRSDTSLVFLAEALLTHPRPPRHYGRLLEALRQCIRRSGRAADLARHLREAAVVAQQLRTFRLLAPVLLEAALDPDPSPAGRLLVVNSLFQLGGQAVLDCGQVMPGIDSELDWNLGGEHPIRPRVRGQVIEVMSSAIAEAAKPAPFSGWSAADCDAALICVRACYATLRVTSEGKQVALSRLRDDYTRIGVPLWDAILEACDVRGLQKQGLRHPTEKRWHELAQGRILLALKESRSSGGRNDPGTASAVESAESDGSLTLVVCRHPILRATDKYDVEEVERHLVLEGPLPLTPMPSPRRLREMRADLETEFPWAGNVLEAVFSDLEGQSLLGAPVLSMPPTLLVGAAGSGKSRLALRLAEELGPPTLHLSLGGMHDTKVLSGTSRGWASGKPGDLATMMAVRRSASATVVLDELDKATDSQGAPSQLQSYLLALLEPQTAARHTDVFLKTECDYLHVLWLGTANKLSTISGPLRSRMRILMLEQPQRDHFGVIAENVVTEMAEKWKLPRWALPDIAELSLAWHQLASARQVRLAVLHGVTAWARGRQCH